MTRTPLAAAAIIAAAAAAVLIPQQATAANSCGVPFEGTTYVVSTPSHLRGLALLNCNPDYDIRVTADITLTQDVDTLMAFGTQVRPFTGTFDGGGHTITGMQVVNPAFDGFGLFGFSDGATLKNVRITRATVLGGGPYGSGGALVGLAYDTTISNVHVSASTVYGLNGMGGLVGGLVRGSITDSSFSGMVSADNTAGGIAGFADGDSNPGSSIARVRTDGTVSGGPGLGGGVAATLIGMPLQQSSSAATVTAGGTAGGLVGRAQSGQFPAAIIDSYATGQVIGEPPSPDGVGGIVGGTCALQPVSLVRNYFAGTLQPNGAGSGGIIGPGTACVVSVGAQATVEGNLWNSDTAGPAGAGSGVGVGRTAAQMKELSTYTGLGWSMVNGWEPAGQSTWGICPQVNDGYPFLQSSGLGAGCTAPVVPPTAAALDATLLPSRRRVVSGQALRIAIRVRNTGGTAASGVAACVRLPARLVLVKAPGAVRSGRVACFRIASVAPGAQATRTVTARAATLRRATVTVTGSARATGISRVAAGTGVRVTVTPRAARARVTG